MINDSGNWPTIYNFVAAPPGSPILPKERVLTGPTGEQILKELNTVRRKARGGFGRPMIPTPNFMLRICRPPMVVACIGAAGYIGWKIGRYIDTKWLKLSGDIGTINTTTHLIDGYFKWKPGCVAAGGQPEDPDAGGRNTTVYYPIGCTTNPDGGYFVSYGVTSEYAEVSMWREACQPAGTCGPYYANHAQWARNELTLGQIVPILDSEGKWCNYTIRSNYGPGGHALCFVRYATADQVMSALGGAPLEDYTTQRVDATTQLAEPFPGDPGSASPQADAIRDSLHQRPLVRQWLGFQINAEVVGGDPTAWPRVPDCRALTRSQCDAAIASAGFSAVGGEKIVIAPDYTLGAGAVARTVPPAGSTTAPSTVIVKYVNPTPMPIKWFGAAQGETYTAYLARLRAAGWLGTALVTQLGVNGGDPAYGAGGVPCTNVIPGTGIAATTTVQFFVNPSSFSGGSSSRGWDCGQAIPGGRECEYDADFFEETGGAFVDWDFIMSGADFSQSTKDAHQAACVEAWAWFEANHGFGSTSERLYLTLKDKENVIPALTSDGSQGSDWDKWEWGPYTANGLTFVVHAYKKKTSPYQLSNLYQKITFRTLIE